MGYEQPPILNFKPRFLNIIQSIAAADAQWNHKPLIRWDDVQGHRADYDQALDSNSRIMAVSYLNNTLDLWFSLAYQYPFIYL